MRTPICPPDIAPPAGQYSHGILTSGPATLHIAGQVGLTPGGDLAEGFEAQVRCAFENLAAVLAAAGMTPEHLVKLTYLLVDPADVPTLRHVRAEYLPEPPPASTTLIVHRLIDPDWLFEVDATAVGNQRNG